MGAILRGATLRLEALGKRAKRRGTLPLALGVVAVSGGGGWALVKRPHLFGLVAVYSFEGARAFSTASRMAGPMRFLAMILPSGSMSQMEGMLSNP